MRSDAPAALDVSLRSAAICIIDDCGKVRLKGINAVGCSEPSLLSGRVGEPDPPRGPEAGTLTQHLIYGLREVGFDFLCMGVR